MDYKDFIKNKKRIDPYTGLPEIPKLNTMLFDFQHDIVAWALKRGRACIFADCGLGKSPMQLEWAKHIPGDVLIAAPLAVAQQTIRESEKFNIGETIGYSRTGEKKGKITITNYEMLDNFNPDDFKGIILDESSILKSYTGKFRNMIIDTFKTVPFRLACTATPAPNDFMELGNHAEFMGVMSRTEMLSMFFVHDGGETQKWRIKGHAEDTFWKWVCSWAVMIRKPSDLGYPDNDFLLPKLNLKEDVCMVSEDQSEEGLLFRLPASTLAERIVERRLTVGIRCEKAAKKANESDETWLLWCNRNDESSLLHRLIPGSVEVNGSMKLEQKEKAMQDFSTGKIRVMITKPSIAGFGMNWQHCFNMAFVGLSDSYEQFYQAVRRCWRFGQKKEVNAHIITANTEGAVVQNIKRKEKDSIIMAEKMVKNMKVYNSENVKGLSRENAEYKRDVETGEAWELHLADCVELASEIKDNSIGYTIFSPPFASLYTYSNSDRDMGNSQSNEEFMQHFNFLVKDMYRITALGRLLSFHCMNLPTSKSHHGYIGIRDFRGHLIKMFEDAGWIYHSEVCIWKNPVVAMQRTKALGLLHRQVVKDSAMSRQGIPDYLVTMRKPGENENPVAGRLEYFCGDQNTFQQTKDMSIDVWQRYASPVWMDINPSRTLQHRSAREEKDERHICPLQLDVIERAMQLWSKKGDKVFSPFAGIGSEGYVALKMGRTFIGSELKDSYFEQAKKNLQAAWNETHELTLFDM